MSELVEILKSELQDPEYREGYDEGFLDQRIATQIRVLRDQRDLTQDQLGKLAGMRQSRISKLEEPNYGSWSINTLRRLAHAFDVRLVVSFEEWNTILHDVEHSGPDDLKRLPFSKDPSFQASAEAVAAEPQPDNVRQINDFMWGNEGPQYFRKPPKKARAEDLYGLGGDSSGGSPGLLPT